MMIFFNDSMSIKTTAYIFEKYILETRKYG